MYIEGVENGGRDRASGRGRDREREEEGDYVTMYTDIHWVVHVHVSSAKTHSLGKTIETF